MRLELLRQNLAKQSNNFESADRDLAYGIWIIEKEFNVGPITDDFLLMKFNNLLSEDNIKRYNESMEKDLPDKAKTMR